MTPYQHVSYCVLLEVLKQNAIEHFLKAVKNFTQKRDVRLSLRSTRKTITKSTNTSQQICTTVLIFFEHANGVQEEERFQGDKENESSLDEEVENERSFLKSLHA